MSNNNGLYSHAHAVRDSESGKEYGGTYIHYRFADYKNQISKFGNDTTSKYIGKDGNLYKQMLKREQANVGDMDEFSKFIESFSDPDSVVQDTFAVAYDAKSVNNISFKGETGISRQSVEQIANEIVSDVENFCAALERAMDEMAQKLDINLGAYKKAVIDTYANGNTIDNKIAKKILNQVLHHEGFVRLDVDSGYNGSGKGVIEKCLQEMILLVEALPEYDSFEGQTWSTGSKKHSGGKTDAGTVFSVLVGKIQGLYNNVAGKASEVAAQAGMLAANKDFIEEQGKILTPINGTTIACKNLECTTTVTGDDMVESKFNSTEKTVSKSDVMVTIKEDGSTKVQYGISVKQYKPKTDTGVSSIKIASGLNFKQLLEDYVLSNHGGGIDYNYVYNVAASRPGKGLRHTSASISGPELTMAWNEIVKAVTLASFVYALSGIAKENSANNAILLVLNGKVFRMADIVERVTSDNLKSRLSMLNDSDKNVAVGRASMMSSNEWKGVSKDIRKTAALYRATRSKEYALQRSDKVRGKVDDVLEKTKMDITLNNLESLLF